MDETTKQIHPDAETFFYSRSVPAFSVMVVALGFDDHIDGSWHKDQYGDQADDHVTGERLKEERYKQDGNSHDAECTAHECLEPFDVHFLLLLWSHGVVSGNKFGEFQDQQAYKDQHGCSDDGRCHI